jgi:hypothetical protein
VDEGEAGLVVGGSEELLPQAATAANTSAPVAQDVNPSRFVMVRFLFLSPCGLEADE